MLRQSGSGAVLKMQDCSHIMALGDDELLRLALDNTPLRPEAGHHLRTCSECQQRLESYKRTNAFLLAHLYRSQCPDATTLNLYCARYLSPDEVISVTQHLDVCPLCSGEVREIRQTLRDFEPFPVGDAQHSGSLHKVVGRIIASLVPWQPQLVTRGEVPHTPWPRQYRAGELNISLHLSRSSNGDMMMLGLFSCVNPDESIEELEGIEAQLYPVFSAQQQDDSDEKMAIPAQGERQKPIISTYIDDLGNVVFKPVPVGSYTLVVQLPQSEVVIEGLKIERN
ncbi:hypothetical protein [Ktedonospora formicarum]|uniref:Uncharacterized protein n=1 Tax=Ktedonospora formicarum TaxID=2778364 RepID=A0A8J3MR82_9CHLR|nr:hypothetical protein [Ktedonospora formicarum]GHO44770.1 hypothetical protein KSX_29330 [Ktedonospora formicarum]